MDGILALRFSLRTKRFGDVLINGLSVIDELVDLVKGA
jgi:hypothetical protein